MKPLGRALTRPVLFLWSLHLSLIARAIRSQGLPEIVTLMTRSARLPSGIPPSEALDTARATCALLGRIGLTQNTCLTRSLVAGTLLSDREGVVLHVSYPVVQNGHVTEPGHAWLTMGARMLDQADVTALAQEVTREAIAIPMLRTRSMKAVSKPHRQTDL
jgi:hypothetical protein